MRASYDGPERTGGLDETELRAVEDALAAHRALIERKNTVLKTIAAAGRLDGELEARIRALDDRHHLEDLYLPFRPKRRTRAGIARERGLECWLSLETLMGCGVGICNGCPVTTRGDGPMGAWPNAKCCVEGPVFSIEAITLEGPGERHGSPRHDPATREPEAEHEPQRGRSGN